MQRFETGTALCPAAGVIRPDLAGRRFALLLIILVLGLALLGGCAGTRGGPIPYDPKSFGQPDSPTVASVNVDDRIAPMDTLSVNVFQVRDLSGDFQVDLLGNVDLPLIGTIKAADMTSAQLDEAITQRLAAKYLQNPEVTVALKSSARRQVTVDGAVNSPGQFPLTGPTTLMEAVAAAKGLSQDANAHRVAIFRQIEGKKTAAAFDLYSIRKGKMADPQVYSGDIIVVDGSKVRQLQHQILMSLPIIGMFNPLIY